MTLALFGGVPVVERVPQRHWPVFTEEDIAAAAQLIRRGEISYGGREGTVERFEDHFSDYIGTRHALAVASGTAALHSAFFAIGLRPGDEVLAPAYTFHGTVMPLFVCNAIPILVDCDPLTGNLDPARLEAQITPRTRAVVVTHLNGYSVDMAAVLAVARRHGLTVIEDCSQAHGAECDGRRVGSIGDVAAFSMQSVKQVTAGAGGVVTTNDDRIHERAVLFGHSLARSTQEVTSGQYRQFATTGLGLNLRIHPVAALLANQSLSRLDQVLRARQRNYEHFDALLAEIPGIRPPLRSPHMTRVAHYSHQLLYRPDELGGVPIERYVQALASEGIPVSRPNSPPLHLEPIFADDTWLVDTPSAARGLRRYEPGDMPGAEAYVASVLRLPVYTEDVRRELDDFAAAFAKVSAHASQLL
ncbi:DegT/DnrJ/EryC1/StrS family aminotransferase [Nonomuraea sp. NPDC004297]